MNKRLRKRIVDRHSDSLKRFGHHPNALYWSSQDIQELRFKVLSAIGVATKDSILDVGCGFADLKTWLASQGIKVRYTGIDISPDLIAVAKEKHGDAGLFVGDLYDGGFKALSFDWVLLSGALNEPYNDKGKYAKKIIKEMYRICRKGVSFNLLNDKVVKAHDLQSFDANEVLDYCLTLCPDCVLRDDYLDNDFTIYMRKI